ncbi:MAG: DUF4783 domain-containing protein [Brumimicrobium sp.]|nr:DUF4783 domain-containing protein [Brumimicrobium sp.]
MSYFVTYFLSLALALSSVLSIPFTELETSFAKADAARIMSYGKPKVLISIENKEGVYSQSQGTQVLKEFFKDNPPKSFSFDFRGKEDGSSSFAVGKYRSETLFRVSVKFKKEGSDYLVESITITRQ